MEINNSNNFLYIVARDKGVRGAVYWGVVFQVSLLLMWVVDYNWGRLWIRLKDKALQNFIEFNNFLIKPLTELTGVQLALLGSMVMWIILVWLAYNLWREEKNEKRLDLEDDSVILDS